MIIVYVFESVQSVIFHEGAATRSITLSLKLSTFGFSHNNYANVWPSCALQVLPCGGRPFHGACDRNCANILDYSSPVVNPMPHLALRRRSRTPGRVFSSIYCWLPRSVIIYTGVYQIRLPVALMGRGVAHQRRGYGGCGCVIARALAVIKLVAGLYLIHV
jgi:hypothetical protein